MGIRVTVDYGSHQSTEPWEKTDLYCLNCGRQEVWICDDGGDYYQGETHMCLSCEHSFNLPHYPTDPDDQDEQRLRQIREYEQQNEDAARGDEQQNCFDRHAGYETLALKWNCGEMK